MTPLRLRDWRERRGLSLRGLAERAGVGYVTVWRIEHGELSPTVAMLEKLAGALGIAVRDFFPVARPGRRPGGRLPTGRG
jgi:transcriptional regulator with XRE-family HTH domain